MALDQKRVSNSHVIVTMDATRDMPCPFPNSIFYYMVCSGGTKVDLFEAAKQGDYINFYHLSQAMLAVTSLQGMLLLLMNLPLLINKLYMLWTKMEPRL